MRTPTLLSLLAASCATVTVSDGADTDEDAGLPFRCAVQEDDAAFTPDPSLLRWPYTSNITVDGATVQWATAPGLVAKLEWGETDDFGTVAEAELEELDRLVDPRQMHTVRLTDLKPDRGYCYRVVMDGKDLTGPMAFRTAPPRDVDRKIRFLVLGDFGGGPGSPAGPVLDEILKHVDEIDFWVTTGDNAYGSGTWQEWEDNIFSFYRHLLRRVSFWPTPGNHDYGSPFQLTPMLTNFDLPKNAYRDFDKERYYSFDWGPAHFVMADSQFAAIQINPIDPVDDMAVWMRDDLKASAEMPWQIAVWHHPLYMTTPGRSAAVPVRVHLAPLVEELEVPLVLNGHNHTYERFSHMKDGVKLEKGGTTYVITGAGGKSLYDIDPQDPRAKDAEASYSAYHFMLFEADSCTLRGRAIGLEGAVLDDFTLTRCE
ncbi:MAG: metallophosphoesterase family protein [Alphaproteobacteria bacterium]|nr:metallophosphoesterase family protein [Alphaproteobacteria bacterium]